MSQDDFCFGRSSSSTWGLIIGILIILAGLSELLGDSITWLNWDVFWPYLIIIMGLLIIGNSLYKR
jgi:hypothetical protein